MTINSYRLPAKIYSYLSGNQDRLVPFEELCIFVYPTSNEAQRTNENFSTEAEYQTRVMDILIFLSDLNLITFNQLTDESSINLSGRN